MDSSEANKKECLSTNQGGAFVGPSPANANSGKNPVAPAPPKSTRQYVKVAFLGGAAEQELGTWCEKVSGPHRCAEADIFVVPDHSLLHDVDKLAAEVDIAVPLFYIVSLGVDITAQTQLAAVKGFLRRLVVWHCVRHGPACGEELRFCVGERLNDMEPAVLKALKRVARAPGSEFSVSRKLVPASGEIFFGELLDVATRRWRNAYVMAPPIPPDHRWLGEIALLAVRVARLTSSETRLSVHRASAQANQTSSDQRSSLWRATKPAQQQTKHAQPDQHNRTYCTWELDLEMHIDRK